MPKNCAFVAKQTIEGPRAGGRPAVSCRRRLAPASRAFPWWIMSSAWQAMVDDGWWWLSYGHTTVKMMFNWWILMVTWWLIMVETDVSCKLTTTYTGWWWLMRDNTGWSWSNKIKINLYCPYNGDTPTWSSSFAGFGGPWICGHGHMRTAVICQAQFSSSLLEAGWVAGMEAM